MKKGGVASPFSPGNESGYLFSRASGTLRQIRTIRETKKLTQLYVASVVGVTTDTISRWENNRYPTIKRDNAEKLAAALEVELTEILQQEGREEEIPTPITEPASAPEGRLWLLPVLALVGVLVALAALFLTRLAARQCRPGPSGRAASCLGT